jgi:hypothetical protein
MTTSDLTLTYTSREAVHAVSDAALARDFMVALTYPYSTHVGLYVVSWMITEIQARGLDAEWADLGAESSPAW